MPNDAGSELVTLTPAPADPYGVEAEFDPELDAPVEESIGRTANSPPPAPKPVAPASAEPPRRALAGSEKGYAEALLREHNGKVAAAAAAAGMDRVYLYRILRRHGIKPSG